MGLIKISMDADIFSCYNLEHPIEKGLSRKNQNRIKNCIYLFFFSLFENNGISILMGDVRPTSSVSTYLYRDRLQGAMAHCGDPHFTGWL